VRVVATHPARAHRLGRRTRAHDRARNEVVDLHEPDTKPDNNEPTTSPNSRPVPTLTTEQLRAVLMLMKGADSVELKASVPDADQRSVVRALEMDPLDAEIRQVAFFDTPDLQLNARGVVVRARRIQGKPADSVVKLRPVDPENLPGSLRKLPGFGVEIDAMPGGFVCSGRLKEGVDPGLATKSFAKGAMSTKLFSKDQRSFFAKHAPDGVELGDLVMLGPVNIMKLKFTPGALGRKMVAELWLYPDGSRVLELSTKCLPSQAFDVAAQTKAFLSERGVDLSAAQQTKTRTALEYFASNLAR
jgi:hypothetical protein